VIPLAQLFGDPELLVERGVKTGLVLAVVWAVYLAFSRGIATARRNDFLTEPVAVWLRRILRLVATLAAVVLALQTLGVLQSAMATLAAVFAMIAIGFVAMWSVASNVMCALILLVTRPFRVGDEVSLLPDAVEGRVVNFNMLYTTLKTGDGAQLQVPNNLFFQRIVRRVPSKECIELDDQLAKREDAEI